MTTAAGPPGMMTPRMPIMMHHFNSQPEPGQLGSVEQMVNYSTMQNAIITNHASHQMMAFMTDLFNKNKPVVTKEDIHKALELSSTGRSQHQQPQEQQPAARGERPQYEDLPEGRGQGEERPDQRGQRGTITPPPQPTTGKKEEESTVPHDDYDGEGTPGTPLPYFEGSKSNWPSWRKREDMAKLDKVKTANELSKITKPEDPRDYWHNQERIHHDPTRGLLPSTNKQADNYWIKQKDVDKRQKDIARDIHYKFDFENKWPRDFPGIEQQIEKLTFLLARCPYEYKDQVTKTTMMDIGGKMALKIDIKSNP